MLQGAFVLATVLSLIGVAIVAWQLARTVRGRPAQDVDTGPVLRGALTFCGAMYAVAAVHGEFGERFRDPDALLYAAVFGLAAGVLAAAGQARQDRPRRRRERALRLSALALPALSGAVAGVAGLV